MKIQNTYYPAIINDIDMTFQLYTVVFLTTAHVPTVGMLLLGMAKPEDTCNLFLTNTCVPLSKVYKPRGQIKQMISMHPPIDFLAYSCIVEKHV